MKSRRDVLTTSGKLAAMLAAVGLLPSVSQAAWSKSAFEAKTMADAGRAHDLRVHLDGARLFNAAVAQGIPVSDLTASVDTATFCLSKNAVFTISGVLRGIFSSGGGGLRSFILTCLTVLRLYTKASRV